MLGVGRTLSWGRKLRGFQNCRFLSVNDPLLSQLFWVLTELPLTGRAQLCNTHNTAVKGLMVRRLGSNDSYILWWGKYSSEEFFKTLKTIKENELCLLKNTSWRLVLAMSKRVSKVESDYFVKSDNSDSRRFSCVYMSVFQFLILVPLFFQHRA